MFRGEKVVTVEDTNEERQRHWQNKAQKHEKIKKMKNEELFCCMLWQTSPAHSRKSFNNDLFSAQTEHHVLLSEVCAAC